MNHLEDLNEQQEIAVRHKDGPLLVLAGAGSGKTRVITCRIAHLINYCGVKPWNILAITFTNKAAKEMKERVSRLLNGDLQGIWIHTFHAACLNILRQHIDLLGFDKNFLIFDSNDQMILIKDCLKTLNISDKNFPPKSVLAEIGKAKDNLTDCTEFSNKYGSDFRLRNIAKIYELYQKNLKNNNALDFDDIIMHTVKIFRQNEEVLEYYSRKFKYIMVDEYQDTNHAQFILVGLLAKYHRNLCVVGDDDQSIYGWRGADISNILDFEKIYDDCKTIKLERNYRSTNVILDAANGVIRNNIGRKSKKLWTDVTGGDKIIHLQLNDEREEANFIAGTIKGKVSKDASYGDFAVLYRVNAQSRTIEDAMGKNGIPYKIYGGIRFYDRKEIKDLTAYLRLLVNANDNVSFKRVINEPKRGIGQATLDKLEAAAQERGISMFTAAMSADRISGLERVSKNLIGFTNMINMLTGLKYTMDLSELVETVIEQTGLEESYVKENTVESQARLENIKEFITGVMEFESEFENDAEDESEGEQEKQNTLEDYLFRVSLSGDIDNMDEQESYVTLMTLHSAKGLEFNEVFIPGFEEELFPGYRSIGDDDRIEEERRLCYVGFTRARKLLYLTNVNSRTIFGQTKYQLVSRFFKEIPKSCLGAMPRERGEGLTKKTSYTNGNYISGKSESLFSFGSTLSKGGKVIDIDDIKRSGIGSGYDYDEGDRVYHGKYGEGTVSLITDEGNESKIEVDFDKFGVKRFMLSMIQLKKI